MDKVMDLSADVLQYIDEHSEETYELLVTLAKIPAPSNHEEKRAEFCKNWLTSQGAQDVHIDPAGNVVYSVGCVRDNPIVVFMAHMDVVFPDTAELPLSVEDGKIKAPGIGDDTANLCALLMCAKYVAQKKLAPQNTGMLFVANTGEEGLGNLKGARQIVKDYGKSICAFYSFDGYSHEIVNSAVGSMRYRVEVVTEGGHSFSDFGNRNAVVFLCSIISTLYSLDVPVTKSKTTYNVGTISGGTSVNSIPQQAEMLYEFRSDSREDLAFMDAHFHAVLESYRAKGIEINASLVGQRPCTGDVNEEKLKELTDRVIETVLHYTGKAPKPSASSTDCNIPLSAGIPGVCLGLVNGGLAHTRQEWVDIDSLKTGYRMAFHLILFHCFN